MSFRLITDSSSNLPTPYINANDISLVYFSYIFNGTEYVCKDTETFDGDTYYRAIKSGAKVTTSQVTPAQYIDVFRPFLEKGQDILFISMSSGISGSFNSANMAKQELEEDFPDRRILLFDTLAASLGQSFFIRKAVECRNAGMTVEETEAELLKIRPCLYQHVMLGDIMYLMKTGRVSAPKALIGAILGIRPILKGSPEGTLVMIGRAKGRKAAIKALVDKYAEVVDRENNKYVGIAYTSSEEDAKELAEKLKEISAPEEFEIVRYEPVTGSHVGPDTVAVFYLGKDNARTL
ncbi:MAG: DegV family protein [Lachnospiraceae bacterium]|nr:DegV family protein [Lachnospiraceae bacterium]